MPEQGIRKPQLISELLKSPHGNLAGYLPVALPAAQEDPDFFAHLVAYDALKGQIRDAHVALPVIALRTATQAEYRENALAHLAMLRPREFARAADFVREAQAGTRRMRRLIERYLRELEADKNRWERTALQHRETLKGLYAKYHIKPSAFADLVLLKGQAPTGRFAVVRQLATLGAEEIAGAMAAYKLPFLVVRGALGARAKEPDVLTALITRMTPAELVTNTKALERLGFKDIPAARAAFEAGLEKASGSKKVTLKTTKAAEAEVDPRIAAKLQALQERQLTALGSIEGRWLVLVDKSGSMEEAITKGREVAALLARLVETVHLVFFDTSPRTIEASGKTLEELTAATRGIAAHGGTSIGCGLQYALDRKWEIDGIALVSDGGENQHPIFAEVYERYTKALGLTPTVYWYQLQGGLPQFFSALELERKQFLANCATAQCDVQVFDLTGGDYYSLPNLVQTMRVGRYQLLDEILATPLLTLDEALPKTA